MGLKRVELLRWNLEKTEQVFLRCHQIRLDMQSDIIQQNLTFVPDFDKQFLSQTGCRSSTVTTFQSEHLEVLLYEYLMDEKTKQTSNYD